MISGLAKTLILLFDLLEIPIPLPAAAVPPQLHITVSADRLVAGPAETLTFTISYSNDIAGGAATGATIVNPIPRFSTFISATGDDGAQLSASPQQGGQGDVVWTLAQLNPGQSGQVSLQALVDPALASDGLLLNEDFESPQYIIGESPSLRSPETWQSASPLLYKVVADPLRPGGQRVLIGSGAAGDASGSKTLFSAASFSGTVGLEMRVHAKSSAIQEYISLGQVQIAFDSQIFNVRLLFGDGDPAPLASLLLVSGQDYMLQCIYDPDQSGLAVRIFPASDPTQFSAGSSCGNPSATQFKLGMFNNQASNSLLVDDISVHRALLNKASISAPGASTRRACAGAMVSPPRAALPTLLPSRSITPIPSFTVTRTFSATRTTTRTQTPTRSPSGTPSPSPSATGTQTQSLTSTPTPSSTTTPTDIDTPSQTPTQTPSVTETFTDVDTPTLSPTETPTDSPTSTATLSSTETPSETPSSSPTLSFTATITSSLTISPSATRTLTALPSSTPSPTPGSSGKGSPTPRPTATTVPTPGHSCMHAGPNPVHDHLVIQCRLESHCHARLILRALDGSVVFERKLGEREGGDWREEIPCGHLSDGIYWLELRGEHESHEKEEARFKVAVRHGHAER